MKIDFIKGYQNNNISFGKIIPCDEVHNVLLERLNSPGRYQDYDKLVFFQKNNPIDIILKNGKNKRLVVIFKNNANQLISKINESYFSSLFNLSPISFLSKMCEKADKINNKNLF